MPTIKRWHPVSHDFVRDPEVQELRRRFGDWTSLMWLEMLSIADRNNGVIKGSPDEIVRGMRWVVVDPCPELAETMTTRARRMCKWSAVRARLALDWMQDRAWLVCVNGGFMTRNYAIYHKTREHIKSHSGIKQAPSEPSEPSEPTEPNLPNLTGKVVIATPVSKSTVARADARADGSVVWEAYAQAYRVRWKTAPVRNKRQNSLVKQFTQRVPLAEAPLIAAFYVGHNGTLYVRAKHPINLLLRDAEGLRTEWATGRQVTDTEAREVDRTAGLGARYRRVVDKFEREEARGEEP